MATSATTACATGCGRPAPGATLCPPCTAELRGTLQLAASIGPDLDDAVARLLRHGTGKRSGTEPPLPVDLRASQAAAELRACLRVRVLAFASDGAPRIGPCCPSCAHLSCQGIRLAGLPGGSVTSMATWLLRRVRAIARHQEAAAVLASVRHAVTMAVRVLEPPPDRIYAGPCPECRHDILALPDAAWADCGHCPAMVCVADRQAAMRAAMEDMLGTASWCARMAGRLGAEVPESTVYSWVRRAQLAAHGDRMPERGGAAQPVYRLGDVLALIDRSPRRQHA